MTNYCNIPTNTQESHKLYTSVEWKSEQYFDEVVKFLKEKNIKSFIDIGGCTGEVSNIILNNVPSIEYGLIFEPHPINYEYTKENVKSDKVVIENKAVFYGKDFLDLSVRNPNIGSWSFLYSEKYPENSIRVQCVNIDDYLNEKEYDFVKIDIEGAEFNLIENSKLLKTVKFIEIEVHHEHFDTYKNENDHLSEYKYSEGNIIDYIFKQFPNHELHYYLSGESEIQKKNPGNMFLCLNDI